VRDLPNHSQVVRDEQVRETALTLKIGEQVQNLRLNRDIESRYRLIADDECGLDGKRAGYADTLPLAPGKLMGISLGVRGIEPDFLE
jgi:hypothetical protein